MNKRPVTSLDWVRWAREQAPARGLSRGQAQLLTQLASHVDRGGECFPSVGALAAGVVLSERHTERLLGELGRLGLVASSRRGRRSALRRLCPDAPLPAPPCPRGTMPLFDAKLKPSFAAPVAVVAVPPSWTSDPPSGGGHKEQKEGTTKGDARCARGLSLDDRPVDQQQQPPAVLEPRLDEVLAVLDAAPGLLVEPLAVNAALAAFPEADHLRAAHTVASWAFQGGLRNGSANLHLLAALRKQSSPPPAGVRRADLQHGGRRRAAPPAPAPVSPAGRRWGPTTDNKFDRAAGLL